MILIRSYLAYCYCHQENAREQREILPYHFISTINHPTTISSYRLRVGLLLDYHLLVPTSVLQAIKSIRYQVFSFVSTHHRTNLLPSFLSVESLYVVHQFVPSYKYTLVCFASYFLTLIPIHFGSSHNHLQLFSFLLE